MRWVPSAISDRPVGREPFNPDHSPVMTTSRGAALKTNDVESLHSLYIANRKSGADQFEVHSHCPPGRCLNTSWAAIAGGHDCETCQGHAPSDVLRKTAKQRPHRRPTTKTHFSCAASWVSGSPFQKGLPETIDISGPCALSPHRMEMALQWRRARM